uniref:Armadillo segment polarity protein n=1 Tax=Megaselia scalaris TaxID=36166 RepID=T1GIX4_MEGSC
MVGGIPEQYLNEYSSNDNNDHHNSGSPNPGAQMQTSQMHAMIPSSAYLKATSQYDEMPDYRITPSPGGIPSNHRYVSGAGGTGPADDSALLYGYISTPTNPTYASRPYLYNDNIPPGAGLVSLPPGSHGHGTLTRIMDDEQELQKHMSQLSMHSHGQRQLQSAQGHHPGDGFVGMDDQNQMRWRDPNLSEVIGFLDNPNNVVKANAAAYLQHLCYMDDPNKQRTRSLGGIPPLISLLSNDDPQKRLWALRNLSYGRQNDENKRAIKNAGGILALINLLRRTNDSDVKELITGIVWNMSSCEDIKRSIIDDGLIVIVSNVIKPHSGWDTISPGETCWSTVFRNASGVLRNVSSAGEYARTKLRECDGLVDCLLYVVRAAIEKSNIGNKIVENAVCILRNLSYRCQEVEDPNYDKHPIPTNQQQTRSSSPKGENLGCFGAGRKKNKDNSSNSSQDQKDFSNAIGNGSASGGLGARNNSTKSFEMLWQPEVVQSYLTLLQSCSNPETLEAAAGAIQNLAACYWQPSIEIRAAVRKEKGLPILVELLRMEVDRVVCAVATALRNLAIDQRNKELIGKYAMRDLVQKLPSGNPNMIKVHRMIQ